MPVNNFSINLGTKHHPGPSAQHVIGVLGEESDLGAQGGKTVLGVDDVTDSRREARRVAHDFTAGIDKFSPASLLASKPASSSTVDQIMRAFRTSSNMTYWARTRQRRRLLVSITSLMTATDNITTITLPTTLASKA